MNWTNHKPGEFLEFDFFGTKATGKFIKSRLGPFGFEDEIRIEVEVISDDSGIQKPGEIATWNASYLVEKS